MMNKVYATIVISFFITLLYLMISSGLKGDEIDRYQSVDWKIRFI